MVSVLQNQPPIPSTPAPVARGQELSAQNFDLLGYPVVPLLPVTLPLPRQGGGVLSMVASPLPIQCTRLQACPRPQAWVTITSTPFQGPTAYVPTHVTPGILLRTSKAPTQSHPLVISEGRGRG